jgi:hypothetical protein
MRVSFAEGGGTNREVEAKTAMSVVNQDKNV